MRVLAIGDVHAPFVHPNYLQFCYDTYTQNALDSVMFMGDVVDSHALSFYQHDPDGLSAGGELDAAKFCLREWILTFPSAKVCIGNHDCRHFRVAHKAGLPTRYLKDYKSVFGTPGWNWKMEHIVDGVLYTHGTGVSGKNAALNLALQRRSSTVIGHVHSFTGVQYHCNSTSRIFGMNAGSGIDIAAYSFNYGQDFPVRPVLGVGIVLNGKEARFVPMPIGKGEKYRRGA